MKICVIDNKETAPDGFFQLIQDYLPDSEMEHILAGIDKYPRACLALLEGKQVIGAAFGWPGRNSLDFCLDGIAVEEAYHRKGYGSALLKAFEEAAVSYGFDAVSLGSAPGYAELFYLHNGYQPMEYKIYRDGQILPIHEFADLADYEQYIRPEEDGFVVMKKSSLQMNHER